MRFGNATGQIQAQPEPFGATSRCEPREDVGQQFGRNARSKVTDGDNRPITILMHFGADLQDDGHALGGVPARVLEEIFQHLPRPVGIDLGG